MLFSRVPYDMESITHPSPPFFFLGILIAESGLICFLTNLLKPASVLVLFFAWIMSWGL